MQQNLKTKMLSKRYITINTDASWYKQHGIGAWAMWIRADNYCVKGSAPFKKQPRSAMTAEAQALVNALTILRAKETDLTSFKLIINNDCKWLHEHIRGQRPMRRPAVIELVRQLRGLLEGIDYELRHVPSHTHNLSTAKSWINDWCDKQAKSAARKLIREGVKVKA